MTCEPWAGAPSSSRHATQSRRRLESAQYTREGGNGGGGGYTDDMEERVKALESVVVEVRDRLARIETKADQFATKADVADAISAQTWRIVTFVTTVCGSLVAVTYFIARHVTP